MSTTARSWLLDLVFISLILSILFFLLLGSRPLFVPDEGRYAEIAREMVTGGDFITPYLNGIKYFEKPVLFYWLTAASIKLFGPTIWAVRLINALLGLFGCVATYFTIRRLFDRPSGILAALILGTSFLFAAMARMVTLDLPVTVFLAISLYAFLLAVDSEHTSRRNWCWLAFAFAGLAVLTKGFIGLVFPCLIVGTWILFFNQWRLLNNLYLASSLCIFLLIILPWHLLAQWFNPEFFDFYILEQHVLRYLSKEVGHYQPVWFFIPCVILGFFPWTAFLPQAIYRLFSKETLHTRAKEIFFLIWAVIIFAFFSFSKSKLIPYILPVFPPLAVITARYLVTRPIPKFSDYLSYFLLLIASFGIAILFNWYAINTALPNPNLAKTFLQFAGWTMIFASCTAFISLFIHPRFSVKLLISGSIIFTLAIFAAMPSVDTRSIYPLAMVLKDKLKPQDEVITYDRYYQDLPFYLQRKVSVLNWRNELSFGMKHQADHSWLINEAEFWQHWKSKKTVYVLMNKEDFQNILVSNPMAKFVLIGQTLTNILATNRA